MLSCQASLYVGCELPSSYGTLTLSEQTIAMNRLVLGERDRFPEIAATFFEVAVRQTRKAMAGWLCHQCERGLIKLEDAHAAAGMLRGMMTMEPQRSDAGTACHPRSRGNRRPSKILRSVVPGRLPA